MSDIRNLIGERMVELLTETCIANAPYEELAAAEIRQGLLQADPVKPRITILINPGNPDNTESRPTWSDAPVNQATLPFNIATYQVGGPSRRILRFAIDINVYLVKTKEIRDQARDVGMWVLGAVEKTIEDNMGISNADGSPIKDEFNNMVILLLLERSDPYEGGGPPSTFIWRSRVYFQVITERQPA